MCDAIGLRVSQRHDTREAASAVNARMATDARACAAAAALFFGVMAAAQQAPTAAERLAAAKLAEARGDFARAEAELRAAAASGDEESRQAAHMQLALLRSRLGIRPDPHADPVQDPLPAGDPVQRLIATIETGSQDLKEVEAACRQLQSLGALAVPPLLAALPKLGPFGLANALWVLGPQQDPRIAPALLARLADADPAITLAIAERLGGLHGAVAVPVARALAAAEGAPAVQLRAFVVLRGKGVADDALGALAVRLAKEPSVHAALLDELDDATDDVALAIHAELMNSGAGSVRAQATLHWLGARKDVGEAEALTRLSPLEPQFQWWVARGLVAAHRDWVRVGLLALRHWEDGREQLNESWFDATEWWRLPEQAAPALLALAARRSSDRQRIAAVVAKIVEQGWLVPAELQQSLERLLLGGNVSEAEYAFVRAIPVGDEDRALATWQRLDASMRRKFTSLVVALDRPWHRVVARQLAACEQAGEVLPKWIERDWTGAPRDAIAALVATVERFPRAADGSWLPWHAAVVNAFRRCPDLPASLLRPLVWYGDAWGALAAREPAQALALAREMPATLLQGNQGLALLRDHGTAEDVPLAVRLLGLTPGSGPVVIEQFLARAGAGRREVVALGGRDIQDANDIRLRVATQAAKAVAVAQLDDWLSLLGTLHANVMLQVGACLEPQLRPEHGPAIARAIERTLHQDPAPPRDAVLGELVRLAGRTDAQCLGALQQVVADREVGGGIRASAAKGILALATTGRHDLLIGMLASPHAEVVAQALLAADLQSDADLRSFAKAALLRCGHELEVGAQLFEGLPPEEASALARDLLSSDRLPQLQTNLCCAALRTARRAKDVVSMVPAIARGASHPSWFVRKAAALELGNTFVREAAPFLLEMLKDEMPDVRKQAQDSLDQLANYLEQREKWERRLK